MWLLDVSQQPKQLAGESEVLSKAASKTQLNPLHSSNHSTEGFAMDCSRVVAGRLVTGGCACVCVCGGGGGEAGASVVATAARKGSGAGGLCVAAGR